VTTGADIATKTGTALAKPLVSWLWRKVNPDTSRLAMISYADNMADAVRRRETDLLDQLRGGPDMVLDGLGFRAEPKLRSAVGDAVGALAHVGGFFRSLTTPKRMVVLGEAGAGKTVLAVHLVLDQLKYRTNLPDAVRADEPVPVRVNAAGWDGTSDFTGWLGSQLAVQYELHRKIAQKMVDTGRILPILDGLDEMDPLGAEPVSAQAALGRLNEPPWRNTPVVVMCRTGKYAEIRLRRGDARLQGATTVALQPFSVKDIRDYLDRYRDQQLSSSDDAWTPVTDQLAHAQDGPLATALNTPWLLSLAATALHRDGHRAAVLLAGCRDTAEVSDFLFRSLIPSALRGTARNARTRDYSEQNVEKWMHRLARHLDNLRNEHSGGNQMALNELWSMAGTWRCSLLHAFSVGLAAILVITPVGGLVFAPIRVLVTAVVFAVVIGVWAFAAEGRGHTESTAERFAWRVPGPPRWRRGLLGGLAVGVVAALFFGVVLGLVRGPKSGLVLGLVSGLTLGLAVGLAFAFGTTDEERLTLGQDGRRIIHDDLIFGTILSLVIGLASGVMGVFAAGLRLGLTEGIREGVAVALIIGVCAAIAMPVSAARYATASFLFGLTGIFPRRPARFLEWGRNTGLLRMTGISYQFRHDTYQQWLLLAQTDRSSPDARYSDSTPRESERGEVDLPVPPTDVTPGDGR
jgi:hypothetical protein